MGQSLGQKLNFVKRHDIDGLNVILVGSDLLLQVFGGDLVVLDHARDLNLFDAIADGDQFCSAPEQSVHFDGADEFFHFDKIGFVVPRLDVEDDVRFGDNFALFVLFCCFALVVSGDTFSLDKY